MKTREGGGGAGSWELGGGSWEGELGESNAKTADRALIQQRPDFTPVDRLITATTLGCPATLIPNVFLLVRDWDYNSSDGLD